MSTEIQKQVKVKLHERNRNREPYDLQALCLAEPMLNTHLKINKFGENSIDFSNPQAVKLLNKAILNHYYSIKHWDFPSENLSPPIPGRADYIHQVADLMADHNAGEIPRGSKVLGLDIGVGASCIYPILGAVEYGWNFIGSDINQKSIASSQKIIESNPTLKDKISCKVQQNSNAFFKGIITHKDKIDFSICNPPFHSSAEDAIKGSKRKIQNLSEKSVKNPTLNFSGIDKELIYEGGEFAFIKGMVLESQSFARNCYWFTTLVSKESNVKGLLKVLEKLPVTEIKKINLETGNKSARILAWSFLSKEEQQAWREARWK